MHPKNIFFSLSGIFLISATLLFSQTEDAFAESKSFTVAARSFQQIPIDLNQGDEMKFLIFVTGGTNDDIDLIISTPDGKKGEGRVYETYSDNFVAGTTGTYVFIFDNTFSLVSNKSVKFSYEITKNTYYVYIDELPDWAGYAGNVMYDATKAWMDANPKMKFYVASTPQEADFRVQWVKEFGVEHVGYAYGDEFIEVGLGDSQCGGKWQPYSSNHVSYIMKHEIGHILGFDHVDDPSSLMYPIALNKEYDWVKQDFTLGKGYGQFIPICSVKDLTSYQFHVSIDDPTHGFDVYFVPSKDSTDKWSKSEKFRYYSSEKCFGENYLSFAGECHGVTKESGLFVITDNVLSKEIAKITVQYKEQTIPKGASLSSIDLKLNTGYHDHAFISVSIFGDELDFSSSRYQEKDDYIRFEDGDGMIIHRYNPSLSFVDLFESFGMTLTDNCLVFQDGRKFCNNDDYSLNFHLNGKPKSSITNYVFKDGDLLDITYKQVPKPVQSSSSTTEQQVSKLVQSPPSVTSEQVTKPASSVEESTVKCGEGTVLIDDECIVESVSENEGGCLIATATFGSELAPQVQFLREIRDNTVLSTASGASFMTAFNAFYYSFSPTVADLERQNPMFKEMVKVTITPLLSSLSLLQYVNIDSETEMLGYGISIILLNIGMYFVAPALIIFRLKSKFS